MVEKLRSLSPSELDCYRDCKARWWVEYVKRIRPAKRPEGLRIGTLTHAVVAAHFRRDAVKKKLPVDGTTSPEEALLIACQQESWDEHKRSTEEDGELALVLGARVAKFLSIAEGRFTPLVINGFAAIERRVSMPLSECTPGVKVPEVIERYYTGGMVGVLDFVGTDEERPAQECILDLKVKSKSITATDDIGPDPQLMIYQALCEYLGHRPHFAYQFKVRASIPVEPPLTTRKPIRLSTNRQHMTDAETFTAAIARHGFKEADYADYLDFLRTKRRFYRAVQGGANRAEVRHCLRDALADAYFMATIATREAAAWPGGHVPATRNRRTFDGSPCMRCPWSAPCGATYGRDFEVACEELVREGRSGTLESMIEIEDEDEGEEIE